MILKQKLAKERLLKGINDTADVVKMTLGQKGKTVLINDKLRMGFHVTKDGVTVAKSITLEDDIENCGAEFIKNSAIGTVNEVGDNTTTTVVLTQKMCNMINSEIELGKNPNDLIKDLKYDLKLVSDYISNTSNKVSNTNDIYNIAKVSSNHDDEISKTIKELYDITGNDVTIDVVEHDGTETTFEVVNGYTMNETGYVAPVFINNFEKHRVEFNNPKVYIVNGKINRMSQPLMDIFLQNSDRNSDDFRPTVLICEEIGEQVLREIHTAYQNGMIYDICIVKSNLIYDDRKNIFTDASVVIDAEYTEEGIGRYGECEKIIIDKYNTTFINGKGNTKNYISKLKKQVDSKKPNIFLNKRIFALETVAAIIKVGGKLSTEISEKKDRYDDAVFAVKSALEEGYSPGASSVYISANKNLDFKTNIMKESLLECYKQLMINAEIEPMYYLKDIHDLGINYGYDLITDRVTNVLDEGIYDSTKGLRVSLENAVHTACNFALINATIS